mmetsp:Transcript_33734/g.96951  ORF Transcript_33734/g.96951 Transcript_33734/m.96951 type:complete len:394 (+) Transcript_33734:1247-2428(+)
MPRSVRALGLAVVAVAAGARGAVSAAHARNVAGAALRYQARAPVAPQLLCGALLAREVGDAPAGREVAAGLAYVSPVRRWSPGALLAHGQVVPQVHAVAGAPRPAAARPVPRGVLAAQLADAAVRNEALACPAALHLPALVVEALHLLLLGAAVEGEGPADAVRPVAELPQLPGTLRRIAAEAVAPLMGGAAFRVVEAEALRRDPALAFLAATAHLLPLAVQAPELLLLEAEALVRQRDGGQAGRGRAAGLAHVGAARRLGPARGGWVHLLLVAEGPVFHEVQGRARGPRPAAILLQFLGCVIPIGLAHPVQRYPAGARSALLHLLALVVEARQLLRAPVLPAEGDRPARVRGPAAALADAPELPEARGEVAGVIQPARTRHERNCGRQQEEC